MSTNTGTDSQAKVFGGVVYECVRCGTKVNADELAQTTRNKVHLRLSSSQEG